MMLSKWLATALLINGNPAFAEPARAPNQMETEVVVSPIDNITTTDQVALDRDEGNRMTVNVSVGGQGPYRFLVDTGAERTIISRELAHRLRLEDGKDAVLHSVIGANDVNTVFIPHLQVSNNIISVVDAPALAKSDIGADGMLGIDSLRSQRVLFDFKANTMSITPSSKRTERVEGETIVVRARARQGRLIFTQAVIDNQRVTVIVDTGSQVTIGNISLQRALMKRRMWNVPQEVTIESVTGEKLSAKVATLDQLELGEVKIEGLAVAFADAHIFKQLGLKNQPALLLGMNAMKAFDRISIDFASKKVRFVLPGTSMRQTVRLASAGGI